MNTPRPLLPEVSGVPSAAIFLSGGGSNAERLLRRYRAEQSAGREPPFQVAALVTDAPNKSRAAELSSLYEVPLVACDIREFYRARGEKRVSIATPRGQEIRAEWTDELRRLLAPFQVTFGVFAGFVPLTNLTADFPCLNVHPGDLTYLKDGQRHLVGLHTIPIERAILDGCDELRSSVIVAAPVEGAGAGMDEGALLGISTPVPLGLDDARREELRQVAAARPAARPAGGYQDALEEYASAAQERLKEGGDWVVLPPVVWDFADNRFYQDDGTGQLYYRRANGTLLPIETVEYGADGSREIRFGG